MVLGEQGLTFALLPSWQRKDACQGFCLSGAALSLIRRRILAPFLLLTRIPSKWGRPGGLICPVLFLTSLSLCRMGGRVYLVSREICRAGLGTASKFTEWSLVPGAFG